MFHCVIAKYSILLHYSQGRKYWRFDDGVLDEDFPRDISVGFEKIPDHLDAAFAIPAHSHHGKERVYFFKGQAFTLNLDLDFTFISINLY